MLVVAALLIAYLLGSIPCGVVIARARGVDLQVVGSGNIGATNAARALGRRWGAVVLAGDAAKAYLPLVAAKRLFAAHPLGDWIVAGVALAAFLGHLYPVWLRFRGGKGVATGLGAFLALDPVSAAIAFALWVAVYALTRTASLSSLVAAASLLPATILGHRPLAYLVLSAVFYSLIVWKHRGNIRRLLRRQETRV